MQTILVALDPRMVCIRKCVCLADPRTVRVRKKICRSGSVDIRVHSLHTSGANGCCVLLYMCLKADVLVNLITYQTSNLAKAGRVSSSLLSIAGSQLQTVSKPIHSVDSVTFCHPSMLLYCCLGDRKVIWPVPSTQVVCCHNSSQEFAFGGQPDLEYKISVSPDECVCTLLFMFASYCDCFLFCKNVWH